MSKKILSIALAVVMLFSVLACTVGAATVTTTFPGDGQCGFRLVTNAYVGMPKGEEVTVKVYWVHPIGTVYTDNIQAQGNVVVAYTDGFALNTSSTTNGNDARTWGATYLDMGLFKDSNVNVSSTYSSGIIGKLSTADQAYGWDTAILVQSAIDTNSGYAPKSGFPVDPDCEFFSLSFTTTREITAADSFGIPSHTIGSTSKIGYPGGTAAKYFTAANTINSEGVAAALVVAGDDTATAKMRPNGADKVDLGITGTVLSASFDAGKTAVLNGAGDVAGYTAANLANVGVQARVNGVVSAAEGTCVYDTGAGFNYRAAITGIDAEGLGAQIEVRTYITDVNGNTYFSNWMFIDATTVHENAVGNGMTGII